jgi:hypothetical protein
MSMRMIMLRGIEDNTCMCKGGGGQAAAVVGGSSRQ